MGTFSTPGPTDLVARISRALPQDMRIESYMIHRAPRADRKEPIDRVFTFDGGWDSVDDVLAAKLRAIRTRVSASGNHPGYPVFEVATRQEAKRISHMEDLKRTHREPDAPEQQALEERLRWSTEPERIKDAQRSRVKAEVATRRKKMPGVAVANAARAAAASDKAGVRAPAPPSKRARAATG